MKKDDISHYYTANPNTPSKKNEINCRFNGIDLKFTTDSGVFSKGGADFGSSLLIQTFIDEKKGENICGNDVLDLGCGYGIIGISIKRVFSHISLTMSDINERAVELARINAKNNNVEFANILVSDGFSNIDKNFDVVLLNPPVRAGKKTIFSLYKQAHEHLNINGKIFVVLQKKQGAPSTFAELERLFGNCETLAVKAGYRVMRSVKTKGDIHDSNI